MVFSDLRDGDKPPQGAVANMQNLFRHGAVGFIDWLSSPELTGKVVPKNSHGSGMRYYVHPAIATYEVIFAQLTPAPEFGVLPYVGHVVCFENCLLVLNT